MQEALYKSPQVILMITRIGEPTETLTTWYPDHMKESDLDLMLVVSSSQANEV